MTVSAKPQLPSQRSLAWLSSRRSGAALLLVLLANLFCSLSRVCGALDMLLTRFLFVYNYYKSRFALRQPNMIPAKQSTFHRNSDLNEDQAAK